MGNIANDNIEERVLKLVRDQWAGANAGKIQVNNRSGFVRGTLYQVSIYDANEDEHENFVYAVGDQVTLFRNVSELALGVGKTSSAQIGRAHV